MTSLGGWYSLLLLISLGLVARANVPAITVSMDSFQDCTICLETVWTEFNSTETIPECRHTFHSECIQGWVQRAHDTCPTCRGKIGRYLEQYLPQVGRQKSPEMAFAVILSLIWFCTLFLSIQSAAIGDDHSLAASSMASPSPALLFLSMCAILIWIFNLFRHGEPAPVGTDIDSRIESLFR